MAFVTKTWKDRLVEFAGRRKLKNVSTNEEVLYDVSRSEGTVMQAGDSFSAANMNDLEQRIKNEFDTVNSSLGGLSFAQDENGKWGYKVGADSVIPFSSGGTVTLTFPNQSRYADQAGTVVSGALTLSIDSDGVSIVSNNISIQTIYVQRPNMTATWTPTVTAELI